MLYVDRILYPVRALGPGERIALWTAGCPRRCAHCANPELWEPRESQRITPERLTRALLWLCENRPVDGLTVTGGEPFAQAEELCRALEPVRVRVGDLLVFSGYTRRELETMESAAGLLALADVLVDGEYRPAENDGRVPLRGSANQVIHYLRSGAEERYRAYLAQGRKIQNIVYEGKILSVGIHNEWRGADGVDQKK